MQSQTKKINKKSIAIPILIASPSIVIGIFCNLNSVMIPILVERVTSSTEKLSLIMATASVAGLIAPYISGMISDRTNTKLGKRKPMVIVSTIMCCIALLFIGISNTYIEIFIFAAILYFGINFYIGSYYSWMPEAVDPSQIGLVNGISKFFYNAGGIIIFGVGVTLFDMYVQLPFLLTVALLLIFTLLVVFKVKEEPNNYVKKEKTKFNFDFIKNKNAMKVFIAIVCASFNMSFFMPYWVPYFKVMNNFTSSDVSYALTILSIVGLCSYFVGVLCDKFDKRKILVLSMGIQVAGFIFGLFIFNIASLWFFAIIWGLGLAFYMTAMYAILPYIAPRERLGEYMGLVTVFNGVAGIIGSLLGGYLIGNGFSIFLMPICIITLIIGMIIIAFGKIKLNQLQ